MKAYVAPCGVAPSADQRVLIAHDAGRLRAAALGRRSDEPTRPDVFKRQCGRASWLVAAHISRATTAS
jgi:hypothetical protein